MFDGLSGQVYTETIQKERPRGRRRIDHVTRGSTRYVARYKHEEVGAATLEQMTIRSILLNLPSLTMAALESVPWEVARRVWQQIKSS